MEGVLEIFNEYSKKSELIGKFVILVYFLSFFIWTGGLKYSVWVGVMALVIKRFVDKEKIEIGPKILAISFVYIFLGTLLTDIITYKETHHISSYDRYNIFFMYFVLINFIKNKIEVEKIMILLGISVIISYIGTIPYFKMIIKDPTVRLESFYDIMGYSHILATASIIFLGYSIYANMKQKKYIFFVLYFISMIMILFTQTRGAILAVLISQSLLFIFCFIKLKDKKRIIVYIAIAFLGWFIVGNNLKKSVCDRFVTTGNTSTNLRMEFWKASIYSIEKNPLLGTGFNGTVKVFKEYFIKNGKWKFIVENYGEKAGNSHNEYLAVLVRHGILVGGYIILFLFFIVPYVYVKNYKTINNDWKSYYLFIPFAILCFYISAVTENVLTAKAGNILIVCISIMTMAIMHSKKSNVKIKI